MVLRETGVEEIPGILAGQEDLLRGKPYLGRRTSVDGLDASRVLRVVDLFCGIGGFFLGLEHAGGMCGRTVHDAFACDINASAAKVYQANYGTDALVDITMIRPKDVPDHDILTAGFPCQPFSNSGLKLGFRDHRGGLFFDAFNIIKEKSPAAFILENVPGLIGSGSKEGNRTPSLLRAQHVIGPTFARMETELCTLGDYRVNWSVLNAAEFGSPQVRRRLFVVGVRRDVSDHPFFFPRGTGTWSNPILSICERREDPVYELHKRALDNILSDYAVRQPRLGPNRDGMIRVGQAYHCKGGNVGQCYSVDGTSPVLTAIWARFFPIMWEAGPDSSMTYVRRVSPREALRLQGFPDDFTPGESEAETYKQAGNAVNVNVVTAICMSLLRQTRI